MALQRRKPAPSPPPPPKVKFPMLRGKINDPVIEDAILVPYEKRPDHPSFPKVHPALLVPGTYYRVRNGNEVATMVTIMPDGTEVAWWNCGACASNMHTCRCRAGVSPGRSIEYIYDKIVAELAGEEWSIHHHNYKGSFSNALAASQKRSRPIWDIPSSSPRKTLTRHPVASQVSPKRTLTRHKPIEVREFTMKDADAGAAASAATLTRRLTRKLMVDQPAKPKRTLTRRKTR